jgi:ATP-dependent exoDNAse (exonuclease V) beta subunit
MPAPQKPALSHAQTSGEFKPEEDSIKVMTMHASKGLEWPVVAVVTSDEKRRPRM